MVLYYYNISAKEKRQKTKIRKKRLISNKAHLDLHCSYRHYSRHHMYEISSCNRVIRRMCCCIDIGPYKDTRRLRQLVFPLRF